MKTETGHIALFSLWRRNPPGREVVKIERCWFYDPHGDATERSVRAHPTHGGRPVVMPVSYLREHYTEVSSSTASERGA